MSPILYKGDFFMQKKIFIAFIFSWSILIWIGIVVGHIIFNLKIHSMAKDNFVLINISLVFVELFYFAIIFFLCNLIINNEIKKSFETYFLTIFLLNLLAIIYIGIYGKKVYYDFKPKKFNTINIIIMGLMLSLFLVLSYLSSLIPPFFLNINFSLKYIPLFYLAFLSNFLQTFVVAFLGGLFEFILPNNQDAGNIWAFIFDYFLPTLLVSIASLAKTDLTKNKFLNIMSWFIFLFIPYFLGYISKVIAGVLFWFSGAWSGFNVWAFSFIYNIPNGVFDFIFATIIIPPICINTIYIKNKYYSNNKKDNL